MQKGYGPVRGGLPLFIPTSTPVTSTTPFVVSSLRRLNGFAGPSLVDAFVLTQAERALFGALNRRGVPFLIIGISAAALEGAPLATQYLDAWFERAHDDERIRLAAADAGGFWISGFGMQPPAFGGDGLERVDVVLTADGLDPFDVEYAHAVQHEIEGVALHILPLDRVIASKRATNRAKDAAQLPALEATLLARRERPAD